MTTKTSWSTLQSSANVRAKATSTTQRREVHAKACGTKLYPVYAYDYAIASGKAYLGDKGPFGGKCSIN